MPSGPVAESESRFDSKLSTLSGEKDTVQEQLGTESDGFGTQAFEEEEEFHQSYSALYRVTTLIQPWTQ